MTAWDLLAAYFPPVGLTGIVIIIGLVVLIGFARHGMDFIKHGFKPAGLDDSLEKRFDALSGQINGLKSEIGGVKSEIDGVKFELADIKNNHFKHLKGYLTVVNGILLDNKLINNENKARLDRELEGL